MRRCEDEKMFYRPPLLEEPCAQTLAGTKTSGWSRRKSRRSDRSDSMRCQTATKKTKIEEK
jgi:hypothetical protein